MSIRFRSIRSRRPLCLSRRGVTVIEVLFAMGIALMGLAGIASLLLLAGRQASDSSRAAEAQALAQDWYGELTARGLNNSAKWIWWQDSATPPSLEWFDKQLGTSSPSKGLGTLYRRELGRQSVCFDPMFFSGRDLNNTLTPSGWYRPSVFPYYHDRYNPTVDPAIAPTPAMQWADQPRMLRVTWAAPTSTFSTPVAMSSRLLEQVFFSQDDLAVVVEPSDNSVAPARGTSFFDTTSSPPLPLGRYAAESQYSWLATLSPTEPLNHATESTDLYTLSLVVVKKRDRIIFDPAVSTPRAPGSGASPNNNPQGERMAWVYPLSGDFVGGAGGRVRLISSDGADATVHVGDWVMLARYYSFELLPSTPNNRPNSVFRWFRVVSVEDEETYGTLPQVLSDLPGPPTTDPYALVPPNDVWAQDIVLEGPDWSFSTPASAPAGESTPTTATLIQGAAAVYERVVNVP